MLRLPKPDECPEVVYEGMMKYLGFLSFWLTHSRAWSTKAEDRPMTQDLIKIMEEFATVVISEENQENNEPDICSYN